MNSDATVRVEWALLSDYALVDSAGKLSVIGIFTRLWAATFPTIHPMLFLVTGWLGEPNRLIAPELRVWGPSKDLLVGAQQQVQLGPDGRANGVYQFAPLPLPNPGAYLFELLADGTSVVHVELIVDRTEGHE